MSSARPSFNVSVENNVDPDELAPLEAASSWPTMFVYLPELVLDVSIYMQSPLQRMAILDDFRL